MATLREVIDYSKNNPDSDYARQALQNLQSGRWDEKAKAEGVDLSFVGRANYSQPEPTAMASDKMSLKDRLKETFGDVTEGFKELQNIGPERGQKATDRMKMMGDSKTFGQGGFGVLAQGLGAFFDTGFSILKTGAKLGMSQEQENALTKKMVEIVQKEPVQDAVGFVQKTMETIREIDPNLAKSIEDSVDLSGVIGATKPVVSTIETAAEIARKGAQMGMKTADKTIEVAGDVARGTGQAVKNIAPDTTGMAESIIASVNKINPSKRIEFKQMTGKSEEEWLRERGIISNREDTVQALADNFVALRKNVDDALDKMPGQYRDPRVTAVADEAAEIARNTESPEAQAMVQLAEKAKGVGLTPKEINELKRFYERNVKVGYMKDPTKTSEQVQRATNRDSALREYMFEVADKNGFGNLREMNKEIQANKYLADQIAGKMEGQQSNNIMGLTDWIVATPGIAVDPKFLAGFGLKKVVSSEGFKSFMAKALAGFPERKPLPRADLDEIEKRAAELLKREEDLRVETQKSAVFADELLKAGHTMSEGPRGFITKNKLADIIDMPLTKQEQAMLRAGERQETYEQVVQYIMEARENGQVVGDGFVMMPADPKYLQLPERAGAIELSDGAKAGTEAIKDNMPKIALGAAGAYYLSEQEDGSVVFPTAALVAMGTMKPSAAVDGLNEAWKTALKRRNTLIQQGLSESHPSVKQLDKALDAIEKERVKYSSQ